MADKQSSNKDSQTAAAREDRLKAALKANLARRKAQSRVRAAQDDAEQQAARAVEQDKDA